MEELLRHQPQRLRRDEDLRSSYKSYRPELTMLGTRTDAAAEVVGISYSVADKHFVMAVHRPVEASEDDRLEAAVSIAEEIVGDAQE